MVCKEFLECLFKGNLNAFLCKFLRTEVGRGAFCDLQNLETTKSFEEFILFPWLLWFGTGSCLTSGEKARSFDLSMSKCTRRKASFARGRTW